MLGLEGLRIQRRRKVDEFRKDSLVAFTNVKRTNVLRVVGDFGDLQSQTPSRSTNIPSQCYTDYGRRYLQSCLVFEQHIIPHVIVVLVTNTFQGFPADESDEAFAVSEAYS